MSVFDNDVETFMLLLCFMFGELELVLHEWELCDVEVFVLV